MREIPRLGLILKEKGTGGLENGFQVIKHSLVILTINFLTCLSLVLKAWYLDGRHLS